MFVQRVAHFQKHANVGAEGVALHGQVGNAAKLDI
jgi:hypothetical protein